LTDRLLARLTIALSAAWAAAQTTAPAHSPPPELPEEVHAALERVEDFSFSFAQPGFYAVLEYLKTTRDSPGHARPPVEVDDWTALLERPADFRGLPVTIEGVVGRNKAWRFEQEAHRHLGPVWQLELWHRDQPIAATVILTNDASDIPLGATIRVTGYFVMMRQYASRTARIHQAALLVARGPTIVSRPVARTHTGSTSSWIVALLVAATAGLVVVWVLLRRSVARSRTATQMPRASHAAPVSLADDLAAWAAEESAKVSGDRADAVAPGASNDTKDADDAGDAAGP
jgi:hypothetical protein